MRTSTADVMASIVIPTFRRPDALQRCLAGIAQLQRPRRFDEIIVVRRLDDPDSGKVIRSFPGEAVTEVIVKYPGVVTAAEAGASRASSDVVAFLDDDAVPRADWLATLLSHYSSDTVGAVGGKDVITDWRPSTEEPSPLPIGRIGGWGRLIGNHHCGTGVPRSVDHLKGVNMSVRRRLLRFPSGLRGEGAQVYNELAICLEIKKAGWTILYDPNAVVDHFLAERHDEDGRANKSRRAISNAAYNLTYILGSLLPERRLKLFLYGVSMGNRAVPGFGRALAALISGDGETFRKFAPCLEGQLAGWLDVARNPLVMRSVPDHLWGD